MYEQDGQWVEYPSLEVGARLRAEGAAVERAAVRERAENLLGHPLPLVALLVWLDGREGQAEAQQDGVASTHPDALCPACYVKVHVWRAQNEVDAQRVGAEKALAPFAGKLVAFLPGGEAKVLASLDSRAVGGGVVSRRERMISLPSKAGAEEVITVAIDLAPEEAPEKRARREGREEGLELARRAVREFNLFDKGVKRITIEAIDRAAEAAKEETDNA